VPIDINDPYTYSPVYSSDQATSAARLQEMQTMLADVQQNPQNYGDNAAYLTEELSKNINTQQQVLDVINAQKAQADVPNLGGLNPEQKAIESAYFNKTGQKLTQVQTAINHLALLKQASDNLGGADAGVVSPLLNMIYNKYNSQDPDKINYDRFSKMSADEIAKFVAGATGNTEKDREAQLDLLSINNSPKARSQAIQAAVQTMLGKVEPITDQYNTAYGTKKSSFDLFSPETLKSLKTIGMLPEDTQVPEDQKSELPPTVKQETGKIYVNPKTGQKITKKDGKWVGVQ